jgi:hypothetical protein
MSSCRVERAGGGREIKPCDAHERPRPERDRDRVAGAAHGDHVAVADLGVIRSRRERLRRAPPELRVAGEQRAAAVEHRGAAKADRQRRDPRERRVGRQRRARHRDGTDLGTTRRAIVGCDRDNARVTFIRIAWLATVLACVITGVVLLLSGYQGYAAVFGAVGACAAINLR